MFWKCFNVSRSLSPVTMEVRACAKRAGKDVIIIGITTDRCRQRLRFNNVCQAAIVLHELSGCYSRSPW